MNSICKKVTNALLAMQRNSWEQAIAAHAFMQMGEEHLTKLLVHDSIVRQTVDGRLGMMQSVLSSTDGMAIVEPLLYCNSNSNSNNNIYTQAIDKIKKWIFIKAPRNSDGIFYHMTDKKQIWIDSMFMASPAIAALGEIEIAYEQICGIRECLFNDKAKAYRQIWDEEKNNFKSDAHWGVGNGWAAAGILHVWCYAHKESSSKISNTLKQYLIEILEGILGYIRPDNLFYNHLDKSDSFVDTNLGQIVAYVIYRGVRAGVLPNKYIAVAEKISEAVYPKINEDGFVEDVCGAPTFDKQGVATEGQVFFLLMENAKNKFLNSK